MKPFLELMELILLVLSLHRRKWQMLTYDVNTNTNYNPEAEKIAARNAPAAVAQFLITERDHQLHTTPTKAFALQRPATKASALAV